MDVSPLLWGIFFEEINHAGDGGLYAEMVQNRAFEASEPSTPPNITSYGSLAPIATFNQTPPLFVRHCNYQGFATPIVSALDDKDSTFAAVPGFLRATLAFMSLNYPNYYLKSSNESNRIVLAPYDGSKEFNETASFDPIPAGNSFHNASFVSIAPSTYRYYMSINNSCTGPCSSQFENGCYDLIVAKNPEHDMRSFALLPPNAEKNAALPWQIVGSASMKVESNEPLNTNTSQYLVVTSTSSGGRNGVSNGGYWGMNVEAGRSYTLNLFSRIDSSSSSSSEGEGNLIAELQSTDGTKTYASCVLDPLQSNWMAQTCTLTAAASANDTNGRLALLLNSSQSVAIDVVSLMPADLPKGQPFRQDLLLMLKNMSPAFVRFPGGTYIDGSTLDGAFLWKKTIGPIWERPGHYNGPWKYWSDDGLGFYEYLVLCEVLKAEPVWVINNGLSVTQEVPTSEIQPWVQDALDSIEFANGPSTSYWGSIRAKMGHEAPFNMKYMAIGNENCGHKNYVGNYLAFYEAIKLEYPSMNLIANCDLGQSAKTDIWDYHIYDSSSTFINSLHRWDTYDRTAPKVFNSEYAVTRDAGLGNVMAAVGEAAWMTGLERNSDVVIMASYAPLFVNTNNRVWSPDAIVFNSSAVYGTPSYWNQVLFAENRGMKLLNSSVSSTGDLTIAASVTCAGTGDNCQSQVIVKLVNFGNDTVTTDMTFENVPSGMKVLSGTVQTLSGEATAENSLSNPTNVAIRSMELMQVGSTMQFKAEPLSVNVMQIKLENPRHPCEKMTYAASSRI
ncbi:uncharacterized protein [Oscarella lobularis]|uniref:uncharacterized protein n=1 Tax=Oscarella lobularis TaxID=121494 RepID=UPI0033142F50